MFEKFFLVFTSDFYNKNKVFDLKNSANRDNAWHPFYILKQKFLELNISLSTIDYLHKDDTNFGLIYLDIPYGRNKNLNYKEEKYLVLFESELICPDNWNLRYHEKFQKIFTWHDDFVDNKKYFKINFAHEIPQFINKDLSKKEKLCTLIAGNKKVQHPLELYSKRLEAIRWFEQYHPEDFHFYGIGWDEYTHENRYIRFLFKKSRIAKFFKPRFISYRGKVKSKKEVLEKYKFAICYENARDIPGYITEKIFDCFFAGCIPIYWGANNIEDHIPQECFIDKRKFETYHKLYSFINNMSDDHYLEYLENIEAFLNSDKVYPFSSEFFANTIVETILDDAKHK